MKDTKFIEKHGLTEAVKKFQLINEYTFITSPTLDEDGNDESDDKSASTEEMPAPNAQNGQAQSPDGMLPPPPAPDMKDAGNANAAPAPQQPTPPTPQPPMPADEKIEDVEMEEDEVIDVDDLTDAQETTEKKVDGINAKLSKLVDVIKDYTAQLDRSNEEIAALKAEFEKRNPTPEEKLKLRAQTSYPYTETPSQFTERKAAEDETYRNAIIAGEDEKYEIKKSDIDSFDMKSISDSFDEPMKLDRYFNF